MWFLRYLAVMWNLLTRLPRLMDGIYPEESTSGALALAPLVGLIMGCMVGLVSIPLSWFLPPLVWPLWSAGIYIWLGWSLHLDGLADLCDGLGSGRRGEGMRAVMKDSRIGAFGVMGLILALGSWAGSLGSFPWFKLPVTLGFMGYLGRLSLLSCAWAGRYPWESGLGKVFVGRLGVAHLALGATWGLLALPVLGPVVLVCGLSIAVLLGVGCARWMNSRLGGVNGDVLGAVEVACEAIMAPLLGAPWLSM